MSIFADPSLEDEEIVDPIDAVLSIIEEQKKPTVTPFWPEGFDPEKLKAMIGQYQSIDMADDDFLSRYETSFPISPKIPLTDDGDHPFDAIRYGSFQVYKPQFVCRISGV